MQPQKKEFTAPNVIHWDKISSSYYWQMKMNMQHPKNYVPEIWGYSKAIGHDEAKDRQQMLMRKILMLHTNNYLERSHEINIFKRAGSAVNKKDDPLYLILRPFEYSIAYDPLLKQFEFIKFLDDFYTLIREKKSPKFLLPKSKATFSKDDYLNIDIQQARIGNDENKLNTYCAQLVRNGHSFTAASSFALKYKEKHIR